MYQIVPSNGNVAAKFELWVHTQWPKLSVGPSKIQGLIESKGRWKQSVDGQAQLDVGGDAAKKMSHTKRGANFGPIAIISGVEALFHCTSASVSMLVHTCGKKRQHSFHCCIATNATSYTTT